MAVLFIAEFQAIGGGGNHPVAGAQVPPMRQQTIAIGGASVPSLTLLPTTTLIRINCDAPCCLAFGVTPVADATMLRMAGNQTEYFSVPPGQGYKVAVITVA